MSVWGVLLVPVGLGSVVGVLALTAWLEQRVLSPRALIRSAARARLGSPAHVEVLVAEQCDRLLHGPDRASV